jgi:hypothetical protein
MSTVLFPSDPQYQTKGGQAQTPPQQRGFLDQLLGGFGLFQQAAPAYASPPKQNGGQLPPSGTSTTPSATTTPPQTSGGAPASSPTPVPADAVYVTEIGCPHMDGKQLTHKGKQVIVPFPSWARKYRVEFSPVYPADEDRDHQLGAFPLGMSEPARGVLDPAVQPPPSVMVTPHWIQVSGNSKADTIRAVMTVYFE